MRIAQFYSRSIYRASRAFAQTSSSIMRRAAREAELVNRKLLPARLWLIVVLQPPAPCALRKADEDGVMLAPLDHELLEVTTALLPHPSRGVRLHRQEEPRVAQPLGLRQRAGVLGREESCK